jgi:hypothetical protein
MRKAPKLSPAEIHRRMSRVRRRVVTAEDLTRAAEIEKAALDAIEPETVDRSSPLPLAGPPPPPIPIPPGHDKDCELERRRQEEIPERMTIPAIGAAATLLPEVRRTFQLLLAHARPGKKGDRWWRVSVSEVGAQVARLLGREPPVAPPLGWNLTSERAPMTPADDYLAAARLLESHLELLEQAGLWRWVFRPALGELYICGNEFIEGLAGNLYRVNAATAKLLNAVCLERPKRHHTAI